MISSGCVDPWEPKVLRAACGAHYHLGLLSHVGWDILTNYWPVNSHIYLTDGCPHDEDECRDEAKSRRTISNYGSSEFEEVIETHEGTLISDSTFKDEELLEAFAKAPLPTADYFSPKYTEAHAVVIASSDTQGMSAEAKKLVYEKHGDLLSVPMTACVTGLNTAVGASLVLFEIMKQHIQQR